MLSSNLPFTIIYLHGFQSSSRSQKAQALEHYLSSQKDLGHINSCAPDLPFSPEETRKIITKLISEKNNPVVMGSSMGGFYASWASQYFKCPAVLINPVAQVETIVEGLIGQTIENIYTGERHQFIEHDMDVFKEIASIQLNHPELIYCLLETGDEVLDYRMAEKKYKLCQQKIINGGDHRFQSFENCLPEILLFYKNALRNSDLN